MPLSGDFEGFARSSGTQAGCPHRPCCHPPRHSPPRTHVWLGWRGCTPSQPLCPPRGSHPQAGDTQALGAVQPPPHLINYFKRLRVSSSGQEIRSCSWEPSSPTSLLPQGTTWRGGGLLCPPFLGANPTISNPTKVAQVPSVSPPPSSTKPPGTPRPAASPGVQRGHGVTQAVPSDGGGGDTQRQKGCWVPLSSEEGCRWGTAHPKSGWGRMRHPLADSAP